MSFRFASAAAQPTVVHAWTPRFVGGLDLGQATDFTALAIIEHVPVGGPFAQPDTDDHQVFHVRHLDRYDLRTPYPAIVDDVSKTLARKPLAQAVELAIDATGVGRGVVDMFAEPKITAPIVPITITGGDAVSKDYEGGLARYRVPKRDLIGDVQVLLQTGRLKIAPQLTFAATLKAELENFKVKISLSGHDSYGAGPSGGELWREGEHDDLVLAVALACWDFLHAERPSAWAW